MHLADLRSIVRTVQIQASVRVVTLRADFHGPTYIPWGVLSYLGATILKLTLWALVLAPFTPDVNSFSLPTEVAKALLSVSQVAVLYYFFSHKTDPSYNKTIVFHAALGYAMAEFVFEYFLHYIYGASGDEREWKYMYTAIVANFIIVSLFNTHSSKCSPQ